MKWLKADNGKAWQMGNRFKPLAIANFHRAFGGQDTFYFNAAFLKLQFPTLIDNINIIPEVKEMLGIDSGLETSYIAKMLWIVSIKGFVAALNIEKLKKSNLLQACFKGFFVRAWYTKRCGL
jgi:hypothetical protein